MSQPQEYFSSQRLLGALDGHVEPVRVPALYRVGLFLVALAMVALPLVYVAVIVLVSWLVYLHAVHNTDLLGSSLFSSIAYGGPLVIGAVGVFFLVKPLFAQRTKPNASYLLGPQAEPRLHAFVARLAELVGARAPAEIRVDLDVNASARLCGAFRGIFSSDLTLTIGLPLAAGLSLRQFTGVLAHELGHFSQGTALRLNAVVMSINLWFARVVYERDSWDEALRNARAPHFALSAVILGAQAFVAVSRGLLWCLMRAGLFLSSFLSRQMEYDADLFEVRVCGSAELAGTFLALRELAVAQERTWAVLNAAWAEGRYCDDVVAFTELLRERMPQEVKEALARAEGPAKAGVFDSHPSDAERISRAQREGGDGIFHLDAPARALFSDFQALCRERSQVLAQQTLESDLERAHRQTAAELVEEFDSRERDRDAFDRYFRDEVTPYRPVLSTLVRNESPVPPEDELRHCREWLMGRKAPAAQRYEKALARIKEASRAAELKAVFAGEEAAKLGLAGLGSGDEVAAALELEGAQGALADAERLCSNRLRATLALLERPEVVARLAGGAALTREAQTLAAATVELAPYFAQLEAWRRELAIYDALLQALPTNQGNALAIHSLMNQARVMLDRVEGVFHPLQQVRYPFPHADGEASVAGYLLAGCQLPDIEEVADIHAAGTQMGQRLGALHERLLARLAVIGEVVERSLGLEPLPAPEKPQAPADSGRASAA
ncbi:MAG: M48 family metallopeptidase [Myxococcales bacterium]